MQALTPGTPAFFNGEFMDLSEIRVSPMDRGFLFGDGVYEMVPAYGATFRDLPGHLARLKMSLSEIQLSNPYSDEQWTAHLSELRSQCDEPNVAVYIQVTRGVAEIRNHAFPKDIAPTVFMFCRPIPEQSPEVLEKGISLVSMEDFRWHKCHIKSISLLGNILAYNQALDAGGDEVLLLRDGVLSEGASSNLFVIEGNTLKTPPVSDKILAGITRQAVLTLAKAEGLSVEEVNIDRASFEAADEIWLSSSTRTLVAVTQIDAQAVGDGKPGALWQKVYRAYRAAHIE